MLTLRLWLGLRALQSGIEKFAGSSDSAQPVPIDGSVNDYGLTETVSAKVYGLSNYSGVPSSLYDKFKSEPLIPAWGLSLYDIILGPAFLILGLFLLVGFATRYTLFAMGLLYTSLTFGLILISQDAGVAWLGTHILLIVAALTLVKFNRFQVLKKW
ncbi:MAG: hypothetical protein EA353_00185 [Puniceicoccaceae bacterium]|nr:MAG: hypothetical protein EA353_00185 [Puniceicoccaceae bacterium]